MPHATDSFDQQEEQDDILIRRALDPENPIGIDFNAELVPGEKADDAVDYGDLSDDDDLPEEEEDSLSVKNETLSATPENQISSFEAFEKFEEDATHSATEKVPDTDPFDDLFGDETSIPTGQDVISKINQAANGSGPVADAFDFEQLNGHGDQSSIPTTSGVLPSTEDNAQILLHPGEDALTTSAMSKDEQVQQYLFSLSKPGFGVKDNTRDLTVDRDQTLAALWPQFERDSIPRFMELLPSKRTRYQGKKPWKPPKPVQPTKASLEFPPDHEKLFRISSSMTKKTAGDDAQSETVPIQPLTPSETSSNGDMDFGSELDGKSVCGVTWHDLQIACEDWDMITGEESSVTEEDINREREGIHKLVSTKGISPKRDDRDRPIQKVKQYPCAYYRADCD